MAGASAVIPSRVSVGVRSLDTRPATVTAFVGVTERGPIGECVEVTSYDEYRRIFGGFTANSGDMDLAVKCYFDEGGRIAEIVRVTHCTVYDDPTSTTSTKATLNLATATPAATSGSVTSAAGPWALANGDTLVVNLDVSGNQTFAIAATSATRESGSAGSGFVLANGNTLTIKIDGGSVLTKIFATGEFSDISNATAAEVVAALNAFFAAGTIGAVASVTNTDKVTIASNRKGLGSHVEVTGGTGNAAIGFSTSVANGTGNVSNVLAVTAAEWVTIMAGLTGGVVSAVSGALKLASSTTGGSSSAQVVSTSTADDEMGFDNAVHYGIAAVAQNTIRVNSKTDGSFGNELSVIVAAASNGLSDHFNLSVVRGGIVVERWINLSLDSAATDYCVDVVNSGYGTQRASNLIALTDLSSTVPSPGNLPAAGTLGPLTGGGDGLVGLVDADYTGGQSASNGSTGLRLLDQVEQLILLCVPGRTTSAVQNGAITYCETNRNGLVYFIADPPAGMTVAQARTYFTSTASLKELTEIASAYYPRVEVDNPNTAVFGSGLTVTAPPSGAIAGLCARLDASKQGGAFEHPASIEVGFLRSVRGLEATTDVRDPVKRGLLFDDRINPIMVATGQPVYVDGARTLKSTGPFPTVGESRGVMFLERTITDALNPKRNRNNRPRLRNEIKMLVEEFMRRLTKAECFASNKDSEAWYFDIGDALNSPAEQAAGNVRSRLGVATSKPAEFIYIEFAPIS